jgi:glycosyltransferase involved in cell wall biosynthesis
MKLELSVTIIVRTLNEEDNIVECLHQCKKNNVNQIIVVDGGSTDQTVKLAKSIPNVEVYETEKGLVKQRDFGLLKVSNSNCVAIVDADDRLDPKCIQNLLSDLERDNADAVQAKHESYEYFSKNPLNYWENAMLMNLKIINKDSFHNSDKINMIGRPALYKKDILNKTIKNNIGKFTTAHEDADLSYQLIQEGAKFTYGTGITYRKHLDTFKKLYKRWISYGSGDAKFILAHKNRTLNVLYHLLINYPFVRSFKVARDYSFKYIPFFALQGIIRFMGLIKYIIFGIGNTDSYKNDAQK